MFLVVEGIDEGTGVSVQNVQDGVTKGFLINRSKWVCCMADSTKVDKTFYYNISDWDSINVLVTDTALSEMKAEKYNNKLELIRV